MSFCKTLCLTLLQLLLCVCTTAAQGSDKAMKYDSFFLEAIVQREKGAGDAAFDLLRHCVEIDSTRPEAYYFLSQYYGEMKDKGAMLRCISKAADLCPDSPTFLEMLANVYIANAKYPEAIATLERAVALDKEREDLIGTLVQLYRNQGDYANAVKCVERLEQLEGKTARLSYAKSEIYTQQGNKLAAIAEMKALADQYPNDMSYRGMYGETLLNNGEADKAYEVFKGICKEEPDNLNALVFMQNYYHTTGQQDKADTLALNILTNRDATADLRKTVLWQCISHNEEQGGDSTKILNLFRRVLATPQTDATMAELCASYMSIKKMPEDTIAAMLRRVLDIEPDNAAARTRLVAYAWERDSMQQVVGLCKAGRQYNPDHMAFCYFEGIAHYRLGQEAEAEGAFKAAVSTGGKEADTDMMSDCYELLGDLLYKQGARREAFAAYDSCLQWNPDNVGCLNNYAYYLSELNTDLDKAERMSAKTIAAEPENATYLDTYAWILFLQGRAAEARVYIDQAIKNDTTDDHVVTEHAGDIYAVTGDTARAVELWRQAASKASPAGKLLLQKIRKRKYIAPKYKRQKR